VSLVRPRTPVRQRCRRRGRDRIAAESRIHGRMAPVSDGPTRQLLANYDKRRSTGSHFRISAAGPEDEREV